jgi:hypothetical protein
MMRVESMGEKEVIVVEAREVNLDMASDDASEKDKNKTGPWFEKHLKHYVMDDERDKAESQQAGEAAGMRKCEGFEVEHGSRYGIETSGSLIHGRLPSLNNPVNGNQGMNCGDQKWKDWCKGLG